MLLVSTHKKELDKQGLSGIFSRYLEQKASPEEVRILLEHFRLEKDSALLKELIMAELKQPLEETNITSLPERELLEKVKRQLHQKFENENNSPAIIPLWRKRSFRLAAPIAAVLLLIAGYIIWNQSNVAPQLTAHAEYGKLREVKLPDGSEAWLNAGTVIHFPKSFNSGKRFVTLESGQVFFDVVHDARKPFVVKTEKALITVLGTSFEVNSFGSEKERISVKTGKVGVQVVDHPGTTFLTPGEKIEISKASNAIHTSLIAVPDIAVWREQKMLFDDQPLGEVMQSLERKYNVHIEIENKRLLSERISTRLNNQPLKDVMTAISFTAHFNYSIPNDSLIVIK